MKKFLTLLLLLLVAPVMASTGPELLIRETSEKVLDEIKTNAKKYEERSAKYLPSWSMKWCCRILISRSMTDLALGRYKDEVR